MTGLRTSELIALEWGDIDSVRGVVWVRRAKVRGELKPPKTEAGIREVKLLPAAAAALIISVAGIKLTSRADRIAEIAVQREEAPSKPLAAR